MTKERFKELSHAVAVFVFVFESSAFSSENDVPAVEGKDGKYTVHHVLRAARGMRAFVPQHLSLRLKKKPRMPLTFRSARFVSIMILPKI